MTHHPARPGDRTTHLRPQRGSQATNPHGSTRRPYRPEKRRQPPKSKVKPRKDEAEGDHAGRIAFQPSMVTLGPGRPSARKPNPLTARRPIRSQQESPIRSRQERPTRSKQGSGQMSQQIL